MSTDTTIKGSNGDKIKAVISGMTKEELHRRAKALAPVIRKAAATPDQWDNDPLQHLAIEVNQLTEKGTIDLEYYADACDQIIRALQDKEYGTGFMDLLPKHTRVNIEKWLELWRSLFISLHYFDRTGNLIDYSAAKFPGDGITEARLLALEEKYLAK